MEADSFYWVSSSLDNADLEINVKSFPFSLWLIWNFGFKCEWVLFLGIFIRKHIQELLVEGMSQLLDLTGLVTGCIYSPLKMNVLVFWITCQSLMSMVGII